MRPKERFFPLFIMINIIKCQSTRVFLVLDKSSICFLASKRGTANSLMLEVRTELWIGAQLYFRVSCK